jgi:hypothetical protein
MGCGQSQPLEGRNPINFEARTDTAGIWDDDFKPKSPHHQLDEGVSSSQIGPPRDFTEMSAPSPIGSQRAAPALPAPAQVGLHGTSPDSCTPQYPFSPPNTSRNYVRHSRVETGIAATTIPAGDLGYDTTNPRTNDEPARTRDTAQIGFTSSAFLDHSSQMMPKPENFQIVPGSPLLIAKSSRPPPKQTVPLQLEKQPHETRLFSQNYDIGQDVGFRDCVGVKWIVARSESLPFSAFASI